MAKDDTTPWVAEVFRCGDLYKKWLVQRQELRLMYDVVLLGEGDLVRDRLPDAEANYDRLEKALKDSLDKLARHWGPYLPFTWPPPTQTELAQERADEINDYIQKLKGQNNANETPRKRSQSGCNVRRRARST